MIYDHIDFHIRGVVPALQHNGQLADPLNKWSRLIKQITAKRKKTDDDYAELAKLEWFGSLYLDEDKHPCWPGENVEALIVASAKKRKEGDFAKRGVIVDGNFKLIYEGPKDPEKMWDSGNFKHTARAGVNRNSIMRTRPIFSTWELKFRVSYMSDIADERMVREWVDIGRFIGLSDWRPKFGRYEVLS